ncbi:MAG: GNAT family N-acetyltransferase [Cyanobacteria bacterium J06607_13]
MHIRPATITDLPRILELIHLKAEFDGCPEAVEATAEALTTTLFCDRPMAHILLAENDAATNTSAQTRPTSPLGFASYHFTYSTFLAKPGLWLDDLFVRSEHRNRAIGATLIQTLCSIASQHSCGRIDWTVDVNNQAGIRFYQRMQGQLQTQVHLCRLNKPAIDQLAQSAKDPLLASS